MNRAYIYLSGFFVCITLFSLIFYFSFKSLESEMKSKQEIQDDVPSTEQGNRQGNQEGPADVGEGNSALEVDAIRKAVVTGNTSFYMQIYNSGSDRVEEQNIAVPAEFIGKDREEVSDLLLDYMENIPLEEYLEGLLSYEIISFSADKMVLRKTYRQDLMMDKFYLVLEDGEVVVYYSDKKTVYDYTGIDSAHLPPEERLKLNVGYAVKDEEELYGILEDYSS